MSKEMIQDGLMDLVDEIHSMGYTILPKEVLEKFKGFCPVCIIKLEEGCEYESCKCYCHKQDNRNVDKA